MPFDNPHVDDPALASFAQLAGEFCALVESHRASDEIPFIHQLHLLLPRLYAAGLLLPSTSILYNAKDETAADDEEESNDHRSAAETVEPVASFDATEPTDQDTRRAMYGSLAAKFGAHCYYREVFDPYQPIDHAEVQGSLADDVTDIYGDLMRGLDKWRQGQTGEALWEWRFGIETHWGEHATGAIRALHARAAWWDTGWPMPGSRAT